MDKRKVTPYEELDYVKEHDEQMAFNKKLNRRIDMVIIGTVICICAAYIIVTIFG